MFYEIYVRLATNVRSVVHSHGCRPEVTFSIQWWPYQWWSGLLKVWPYLNLMLFQLINVTCTFLIHLVLKTAPDFVIYWVYVRDVRWHWPEVGRDEFWCGLVQIFNGCRDWELWGIIRLFKFL